MLSILDRIRELADKVEEYADPLSRTDLARLNLSNRLLFNENLLLPDEYYNNIINKIRNELSSAIRFYPSVSYKKYVTDKVAELYKIPREKLTLIAGADEGIKAMFDICKLLNIDTLVIVRPCYSLPRIYAKNYGLKIIDVLIDVENLKLPQETLENVLETLHTQGCLVYLCTPNNPLGIEFDFNDIFKLVTKFDNALFLIDETYFEFGTNDFAKLAEKVDNVVVIRSFSKSWGLAGLRLGYVVTSHDLVKLFNAILQPFNISNLALRILEVALECYDIIRKYIEEVKILREKFREEVISRLCKYVKRVFPSYTNFVSIEFKEFVDIRKLYSELVERGYYVRTVSEPLCEHIIRVTMAPWNILDNLIKSIQEIVAKLVET